MGDGWEVNLAKKKRSLRNDPLVQQDIKHMSTMDKSAGDIIRAIREKYGRGYRVKEMKQDIARYKNRAADEAKRIKSVPKKFQDKDGREHILIVKTHTFSQDRAEPMEVTRIPTHSMNRAIDMVLDIDNSTGKNVYYEISFSLGTKENLYKKVLLLSTYTKVESFTIIPTTARAKVLNALVVMHDTNTAPISGSLQDIASQSEVKTFRDMVRREIV